MRHLLMTLVLLVGLVAGQTASACVGKTLFVGVPGSAQELLYAELISQLVSERTGTTVKIVQFRDSSELYAAVRKGEVGVLVESPERALRQLDLKESNPRQAYDLAKKEYRKSLNLVWLEPFGGSQSYAPVISVDTMGHLPALPKLLNKLSGVLTEESCSKLQKALKADEKPRRIARDFLKAKKLI